MAYPKTILCVDDDSDDRFFLSTTINGLTHQFPLLKRKMDVMHLNICLRQKKKTDFPVLLF